MKQYFAKYLPVEGEIKEGDTYRVKGTEKILVANKYFKEMDQSLLEKVKLFLCSRDIQAGDEYYFLPNPIYYSENKQTYKRLDQKLVEENPLLPRFMYKVIGEISPEATWVREGDKFDLTDFNPLSAAAIEHNKPIVQPIRIKYLHGNFH